MSFSGVPWFVGGGAEHAPEVARLLAYAAFGGAEGIVEAPDLKVVALDVPGSSVRVLTGAVAINSRASGGSRQAYADRMSTEEVLAISATSSGAGRNDLIIARVEDPFMAGEPWSAPADPTVGPYIFTRVVPNVPASAIASPEAASAYLVAQGYSAIPLAGLTIPASTGTITADLIKDLRFIARPRRKRLQFTTTPPGNQGLFSSIYVNWPSYANKTVAVPAWPAQAVITVQMGGVQSYAGATYGRLRARLGVSGASVGTTVVYTREAGFDVNTPAINNVDRAAYIWGDTLTIPAALRGTVQPFELEGRKDGGDAVIEANPLTSIIMDIEFIEVPV